MQEIPSTVVLGEVDRENDPGVCLFPTATYLIELQGQVLTLRDSQPSKCSKTSQDSPPGWHNFMSIQSQRD